MNNQTNEAVNQANLGAAKKPMTRESAAAKHLRTMPDKQLLNRVKNYPRRKECKNEINIDIVHAIVLSLVMENTKPLGRMEPYLR